MGGLPDIGAGGVAEDEVGGALGAVGEGLHTGMDRPGGGMAGTERRGKEGRQRDGRGEGYASDRCHDRETIDSAEPYGSGACQTSSFGYPIGS